MVIHILGRNAEEKAVEGTHGSFRTKGEGESTEGLVEVQGDDVQCTKVLRDGQIYIMYKGTMYNVQGNQLK